MASQAPKGPLYPCCEEGIVEGWGWDAPGPRPAGSVQANGREGEFGKAEREGLQTLWVEPLNLRGGPGGIVGQRN